MSCNVGDEVQFRQQKAVVKSQYVNNGIAYLVVSPPFVFADFYKSHIREDEVKILRGHTFQNQKL